MIRGVLLDYSGTLFRLEPGPEWFSGTDLTQAQRDSLLADLTAPVGPSAHLPPDLQDDWRRRDLDPEIHRSVHLAALRAAGMEVTPGLAEHLYERLVSPDSWHPYRDTAAALRLLADVPVAVLSNIAWDIRPVFDRHGLTDSVDAFVLSYEEGMVKPDPKIFLLACERIGLPPEQVLMVGDSVEADGAATGVGCRFERVEPQATAVRGDALIEALGRHGLAG